MRNFNAVFTLVNPDGLTTDTLTVVASQLTVNAIVAKELSVRALLPLGEARRILNVYFGQQVDPDARPQVRLERVK